MNKSKDEFTRCEICGAVLKKKNLVAHMLKVHPEKKDDLMDAQPRFRGKGFDPDKLPEKYRKGWGKFFDAQIAREEGNYDLAILILKKLEAEYPLSADIEYELGLSYLGKEEYKEALNAFQKTAEMKPNYYGVKKSIRKCNEALSLLSLTDIPPSIAGKVKDSAEGALGEGRTEFTQRIAQKLLANYPHIPTVLDLMGRVQNDRLNFKGASKYLLRAIELDPKEPAFYSNLGISLMGLEKYEEALKVYKKAIEMDPEFPQAWYNSGVALSRLGRKEEALRYFNRAIAIDKDYYMAWCAKYRALEETGRKKEAGEALIKALRLNSSYVIRSAFGLERYHKSRMSKETERDRNKSKRKHR